MSEKKRIPVSEIAKNVRKSFGKESVFLMQGDSLSAVPAYSTGSPSLDAAIGVGGIPKGRIIEIFGPESSGKTSLATIIAAQVQKEGGVAAYIDVENALDPVHARELGADIDNLLISQPDSAEDALRLVKFYVNNNYVDVVVIDSVAALVPEAELKGDDASTGQIGHVARIMSKFLSQIKTEASKTDTTILMINQTRQKIGVMFGNPETTPGGNALKFYSSVRIRTSKGKAIMQGDKMVGTETKFKIVKNKVAPPFKTALAYLMFDSGFDAVREQLEQWVDAKVVKKAGSWYSFKDDNIGQGDAQVAENLKANPDLFKAIVAEYNKLTEG